MIIGERPNKKNIESLDFTLKKSKSFDFKAFKWKKIISYLILVKTLRKCGLPEPSWSDGAIYLTLMRSSWAGLWGSLLVRIQERVYIVYVRLWKWLKGTRSTSLERRGRIRYWKCATPNRYDFITYFIYLAMTISLIKNWPIYIGIENIKLWMLANNI